MLNVQIIAFPLVCLIVLVCSLHSARSIICDYLHCSHWILGILGTSSIFAHFWKMAETAAAAITAGEDVDMQDAQSEATSSLSDASSQQLPSSNASSTVQTDSHIPLVSAIAFPAGAKQGDSQALQPELLSVYYRKLFPSNLFYRWLNYGHNSETEKKNFFSLREFCFTLKDDVYIRYRSYENQKELEKGMQEYIPYKIDIGPVYSARIKDTKLNSAIVAVQRELIFDIDMTDYDSVRICPCTGIAKVCPLCWPLMALAIKILHRALTEDFGFQHILWVYSGRRGVHGWVCDKKARFLSQSAREAIVKYLTLVQGGNIGKARTVRINDFDVHHVATERALKLVEEYFMENLIRDQKLMETGKGVSKVLAMLEDQELIEKVEKAIEHVPGSERRWDRLCQEVNEWLAKKQEGAKKEGKKADPAFYKNANTLKEIQVQFCYPRLDVNVSHSLNHLLKSPFSVHPKTGQVCVPINPDMVDSFDPGEAPKVGNLIGELNALDDNAPDFAEGKENAQSAGSLWKRTSLKEAVLHLEHFVKKMEATWRRVKREEEDSKMSF